MLSSINFKKTIFQLIVVYLFTLVGGFIIAVNLDTANSAGIDVAPLYASEAHKTVRTVASLLLCFLPSLLLFILQRTNFLEVIALIILLCFSSLTNLYIFNYQIAGLLPDFVLIVSHVLAAKIISIFILFIKRKFNGKIEFGEKKRS